MFGTKRVHALHRMGGNQVLGDAWSEREQGHGGDSQPSHTSSLHRPT
jgi:hypothetical protein